MLCDMGMMINRRRACSGVEKLPYGAIRIEYLESSATQKIILNDVIGGIAHHAIEAKILFKQNTNCYYIAGNANSLKQSELMGGFYAGVFDKVIIQTYVSGGGQQIIILGNENTVLDIKTINRKTYVNGQYIDTITNNPIAAEGKFALFGAAQGGDFPSFSRIYNFKIYSDMTDSTIVHNLIPVRVGNVGYMYDRVSKQLFGNSGTGNFILGNDI